MCNLWTVAQKWAAKFGLFLALLLVLGPPVSASPADDFSDLPPIYRKWIGMQGGRFVSIIHGLRSDDRNVLIVWPSRRTRFAWIKALLQRVGIPRFHHPHVPEVDLQGLDEFSRFQGAVGRLGGGQVQLVGREFDRTGEHLGRWSKGLRSVAYEGRFSEFSVERMVEAGVRYPELLRAEIIDMDLDIARQDLRSFNAAELEHTLLDPENWKQKANGVRRLLINVQGDSGMFVGYNLSDHPDWNPRGRILLVYDPRLAETEAGPLKILYSHVSSDVRQVWNEHYGNLAGIKEYLSANPKALEGGWLRRAIRAVRGPTPWPMLPTKAP